MSWLFSKAMMEDYANSHSLQEREAESSAENSLDGEQCALWNGTPTQRASWLPAKTTGACRLSRSGMTFRPSTDTHGEAVLMSFLAAFPARIFPQPEKVPGSSASDPVCGSTWRELWVKWNPDTSSWKTHQCLWEEDLSESSVILPRWGMMRDGALWERTMPVLRTKGKESGWWPTPTKTVGPKRDLEAIAEAQARFKAGLSKFNPGVTLEAAIGGYPNPPWTEWLMGWPMSWTDTKGSAMAKFQQWSASHGIY
jgi:hypothetical protein